MDVNARHCQALVRQFDRDRYLATLFASVQHRGALYALYAFNVELGRVRELAREPMPGEIRLQWWREVLDGQRDGEAAAHPVAASLRDALSRYDIRREILHVMIDARAFDLYDDLFETIADWESYAERTDAGLTSCATAVLAGRQSIDDAVIRHAGRALAGAEMLRRFAFLLARGKIDVPVEVLDHFGAKPEDALAGRITPEWRAALAEMRLRIRRDLGAAAAVLSGITVAALPALLPCALVRPTLARMESRKYDPLRPDELPQWRRQWLLWRAARRPVRIFG